MGRKLENSPSSTIITLINTKIINEQWSPEQISCWLKLHNYENVSHTWIYRHIARDKAADGELHNHMRRGYYHKGHKEYRGKIQNRVSIDLRPDVVNNRERLGDFEVDLIVEPKDQGAILTLIDRVSRECIIEKLDGKMASGVSKKIIQTLGKQVLKPHTITSDNGTEFTEHQAIAKSLGIKYFFAHPYASYERGGIENLNGLIRQYIPKGTVFDDITNEDVKIIQNKLNTRPRKVLDFLTPQEYSKKEVEQKRK